LGQIGQAGDYFLLLLRSDPQTIYFDAIPLAWAPAEVPPELTQKAKLWLARDEAPAAVLLGASYLLTSSGATEAAEKLRALSLDDDPRIAALAGAQRWRTEIATANDHQIDRWGEQIESMPEPLRAGPYFLVGLALARTSRLESAALSLLRAPVLYPRQRELSARALLEAGRVLEKLEQPLEASRLYRELLKRHKEDPSAVEAQQRIEALAGHP